VVNIVALIALIDNI